MIFLHHERRRLGRQFEMNHCLGYMLADESSSITSSSNSFKQCSFSCLCNLASLPLSHTLSFSLLLCSSSSFVAQTNPSLMGLRFYLDLFEKENRIFIHVLCIWKGSCFLFSFKQSNRVAVRFCLASNRKCVSDEPVKTLRPSFAIAAAVTVTTAAAPTDDPHSRSCFNIDN